MFLIGFAIVLLSIIITIIVLDGYAYILIDLPSMVIIICSVLGVLTATKSFKVFYIGLRAAILPETEITSDMRGRAASLFRLLSKTVAIVAVIAVLGCLRNLMYVWDFSSARAASKIGINLYALLMVPLYAMLLAAAVFEPVVFILKKRQLKAAPNSPRTLSD